MRPCPWAGSPRYSRKTLDERPQAAEVVDGGPMPAPAQHSATSSTGGDGSEQCPQCGRKKRPNFKLCYTCNQQAKEASSRNSGCTPRPHLCTILAFPMGRHIDVQGITARCGVLSDGKHKNAKFKA